MSRQLATFANASGRAAGRCATTQWTVVREAASAKGDTSRRALQQLCAAYWYPVFSVLRRHGQSPADAEDACQSFFAWVVESNLPGRADAGRGRFRDFLLAAVRQFLAREHRHTSAAKRSPPGDGVWSLDVTDGERRLAQAEPVSAGASPEARFEADWARTLVDGAIETVRAEWAAAGRAEKFDLLRDHLTDPGDAGGSAVAAKLGMSEGAFRVALHRLKQRFGEALREAVADTLAEGENIDAELTSLRQALGGGR